jgi:hypothetical protein
VPERGAQVVRDPREEHRPLVLGLVRGTPDHLHDRPHGEEREHEHHRAPHDERGVEVLLHAPSREAHPVIALAVHREPHPELVRLAVVQVHVRVAPISLVDRAAQEPHDRARVARHAHAVVVVHGEDEDAVVLRELRQELLLLARRHHLERRADGLEVRHEGRDAAHRIGARDVLAKEEGSGKAGEREGAEDDGEERREKRARLHRIGWPSGTNA